MDPAIEKKVEKVQVKNFSLMEILDSKLRNDAELAALGAVPIFVVFAIKGKPELIVLSNQNLKELEDKIVHVESQNPDLVDKFISILQKLKV